MQRRNPVPDFRPDIPRLFVTDFKVDYGAPFRRHLNRLEVEIGGEDYRHLKKVELLDESPSEAQFAAMEEITSRVLETTQNNYNRELLQRLGIRVYLDVPRYAVYYRLPDRALRFIASWRQKALARFFHEIPIEDTGWRPCGSALPGFSGRFLPDRSGGVLLLRQNGRPGREWPLITATHGPYDPHTLDVALYFLRTGKAGAALINLGFSGREPLTDANLEKLKRWGVPLNPSNIDVIYPYTDEEGHPYCYKLEEGLGRLVDLLDIEPPGLILDIHGCVGTQPEDVRLVVGLGGVPPFPRLEVLGETRREKDVIHLRSHPVLHRGLSLLRDLSDEIYVQLCTAPHTCYHFFVLGGLQLLGREVDTRNEVRSLLPGEERTFLPREDIRWLPGARGNSLQRKEARKLSPEALCLHVEIPTFVRNRMALRLRELEITDSLDSSGL
jgi:hypothetical protein